MSINKIIKFKLSILLVTYNHQAHLHKALESIFEQKFDELIELVIADDSSSDDTMAIINCYEGRDSRFIFKYLNNSNNLGITRNYQRGFAACSGQYVAVLEGDDYWISPFKLQRQIDFLDTHWESNLCSVNYFVFEEDRSHFYPRGTVGKGYRLLGARELIADNLVGNFSTCMYRKSALNELPEELFSIRSYDWIVNIYVARESMIGFLEEPMSVYRLHSGGAWTQKTHIEKLKEQLDIIPAYDALTNKIFRYEFDLLSSGLRHAIAVSQIGKATQKVAKPLVSGVTHLLDYMPPILVVFGRAILPPVLKKLILRVLNGSRAR